MVMFITDIRNVARVAGKSVSCSRNSSHFPPKKSHFRIPLPIAGTRFQQKHIYRRVPFSIQSGEHYLCRWHKYLHAFSFFHAYVKDEDEHFRLKGKICIPLCLHLFKCFHLVFSSGSYLSLCKENEATDTCRCQHHPIFISEFAPIHLDRNPCCRLTSFFPWSEHHTAYFHPTWVQLSRTWQGWQLVNTKHFS